MTTEFQITSPKKKKIERKIQLGKKRGKLSTSADLQWICYDYDRNKLTIATTINN